MVMVKMSYMRSTGKCRARTVRSVSRQLSRLSHQLIQLLRSSSKANCDMAGRCKGMH